VQRRLFVQNKTEPKTVQSWSQFLTPINFAVPDFVDQDLSPRGMSHSAQYCQRKWAIVLVSQEAATRQTRRPALLRLVSTHSTPTIERIARARLGHNGADRGRRRRRMHPEDLMNADVLSELVLLVSASLIFDHVVGDLGGRADANSYAALARYARGSR
jgi:hypothetical protein